MSATMPALMRAAGARALENRSGASAFDSLVTPDETDPDWTLDPAADLTGARIRRAEQPGSCQAVEAVFIWGAQRCGQETQWETVPDDFDDRARSVCIEHIEKMR